jgi:hypothetical protein
MILEKTFKMHIGFWFTFQSNRQSTVIFDSFFKNQNIQHFGFTYYKFTYIIPCESSIIQIKKENYQYPHNKARSNNKNFCYLEYSISVTSLLTTHIDFTDFWSSHSFYYDH